MALIKDRFIPRKEISNLYFNMGDGISTHSLSMWLKSKTDNEFIVVPKGFVFTMIIFWEQELKKNADRLGDITSILEEVEAVKKYL